MANPDARAAVQGLQARGMSQRQIGQALGIDSGAVSQIARGARGPGYGAHYIAALRELEQQGRVETAPARRLTKSGLPARVRQPAQRIEGGRVYERRTPAAGAHRLDAAGSQMVMVTIEFAEIKRYHGKAGMVSGNTVTLPPVRADELRGRMPGDTGGAWAQLAMREAGVDQVRGFEGVTIVQLDE